MGRAVQLAVGVGATLSFGAMGGWILWWAVATSWTARVALDWPTVRGEVVSSQLGLVYVSAVMLGWMAFAAARGI